MKEDVFPATMNTWIDRKLEEGDRAEVNRHIMEVYAEPLTVYFRKHSLRWLGDPEEIVNGFFASGTAR